MTLEWNKVNGYLDDGYHLGNLFLDYMNSCTEDYIWQIDAGTGKTESKSSVKSRSIRLARCLRHAGLRPGDVVVVSGRNHLDVHIPFYAAYMNGLPVAGVDPGYKYVEIKSHFETSKPKIVFCETENFADIERAVKDLNLDTKTVTFGDGDHSLANFMNLHDDHAPEDTFEVATFDTENVYAWLISTSGTTGLPKIAAFKHTVIIKVLRLYATFKQKEIQPALNLSSIQWISSYYASLAMITGNHIKVQSSLPLTTEHAIDIINKYRPVTITTSPTLFTGIVRHQKHCDLTSFKTILITGSPINQDILRMLKLRLRPEAQVWNLFGQTECLGGVLKPCPDGPEGNVGSDMPLYQNQLVDPKTGEIISEANKPGELWIKGPTLSAYYGNPVATAEAFSADGWYKTSDILYRDQNGFFFFVDRMSSAFKYRGFYVMPSEVEKVIMSHPDVLDACVVGIPHPEDGKQAVAVVRRTPGRAVSEQDIKDIVAERLTLSKHLHGGVIFVDNLPRTVTGKIRRVKVLDMVVRSRNTESSEPVTQGNKSALPCN